MNLKAVKAPPEVRWNEDLQPVEPEEVEGILRTIDTAIVEIRLKGSVISVTTPMTNMTLRRRGNGDTIN